MSRLRRTHRAQSLRRPFVLKDYNEEGGICSGNPEACLYGSPRRRHLTQKMNRLLCDDFKPHGGERFSRKKFGAWVFDVPEGLSATLLNRGTGRHQGPKRGCFFVTNHGRRGFSLVVVPPGPHCW